MPATKKSASNIGSVTEAVHELALEGPRPECQGAGRWQPMPSRPRRRFDWFSHCRATPSSFASPDAPKQSGPRATEMWHLPSARRLPCESRRGPVLYSPRHRSRQRVQRALLRRLTDPLHLRPVDLVRLRDLTVRRRRGQHRREHLVLLRPRQPRPRRNLPPTRDHCANKPLDLARFHYVS